MPFGERVLPPLVHPELLKVAFGFCGPPARELQWLPEYLTFEFCRGRMCRRIENVVLPARRAPGALPMAFKGFRTSFGAPFLDRHRSAGSKRTGVA